VQAELDLLRHGVIDIQGRMVDASNATLFGKIELDGVSRECVWKPVAGERPLWDFPDGTLAGREVAAYALSSATGWDIVPPTVLRDGPYGAGMCQLWIDADEERGRVDIQERDAPEPGWRLVAPVALQEDPEVPPRPALFVHADREDLRRVTVFDAVANNADRKAGHLLADAADRTYGIDHGICFHTEDKLRTVLWGWAGDPLPDDCVETLKELRTKFSGALGEELSLHLTPDEVAAALMRVDRLLESGKHPVPDGRRPAVPWPLI
jgi:uncharacterized repeat protein (TIGR03843 family)